MISLLCPTRGRPANVARMMTSALETAAGPLEFVFRADDDDPYPMRPQDVLTDSVVLLSGPRATLSSLWNECQRAASGDIFMQCDDEVVFNSPGWDAAIDCTFNEVPDRILFVHGDDRYQPAGSFGTLGFLHRRWVETVGYFTPPWFSCDYGDTWLNDVANMIGRRRYLPGVVTEHLHPIANKAPWDQTHIERLERGRQDNVAALYASLADKRAEDAEKLRALLGTPA